MCCGNVFDCDGESDTGALVFGAVFGIAAVGRKSHLPACGWKFRWTSINLGACSGDDWWKYVWDFRNPAVYSTVFRTLRAVPFVCEETIERPQGVRE